MRRRLLHPCAAALCLTAMPIVTAVAPAVAPAFAAAATPSAFTPLAAPARLADTRASGAVGANVTISVAVTGAAPLPAAGSIVAAVLNVTVVGPASAGYWTVYPSEATLPTASNINVDPVAAFSGSALALPNLVTVPVGPSGVVDIYSLSGGNVIVDMLGYYSAAASATAGRFVPLAAPSRMLDTRTTNTPMVQGETRTFAAPGGAGASAVALNVTAIGSGPGYWQVFPAGANPPISSNLNTIAAGQVTANQVIVPVDATGQFSVYSQSGGDLVIDLVGTFTGAAAPDSADGLFVPLATPTRFLDTRTPALNPLGGTTRLLPGWDVEVGVASNPAINRPDVSAVVMNLTVTDTFAAGYVSVTPAGSNNPAAKTRTTSNLNVVRVAETLANHAIVPVSARGFDVFAQNPTHAVADVSGYYIGTPVAAPFGGPQNTDPTPAFCQGFSSEAIQLSQQGTVSSNVSTVQQRLLALGFWTNGPDNNYGWSTQQAVMAYQKWFGLPASGKVDAATAAKLMYPNCRPTAGTTSGDLFEVDKGRQLGFFIRGGKMLWVIHVSTGGGYFYETDNKLDGSKITGTAITTNGNFNIYRVSDVPVYKGTLGTLYRPRFVVGGIAVHGAPNVPNYPASHGCIRVSNPAMDFIWAQNLLPLHSRVWIHD